MKKLMGALLLCAATARAGQFTIREENDVWTGSDTQYTQGLELEYRYRTEGPWTEEAHSIRNTLYTPQDITIATPQPDDHPWASMTAYTYKRGHPMENDVYYEEGFVFGVVGPWSGGEQIQSDFHKLIGSPHPEGWANQIPNEPIVNLTADGTQRTFHFNYGPMGLDNLNTFGTSFGNAMTDLHGGSILRAGYNLPYTQSQHITITETPKPKPFVYVYGGSRAFAVAHNIFIEGSLFQDSPGVTAKPLVYEYTGGVAVGIPLWKQSMLKVQYDITRRSEEYVGQPSMTDFGAFIVSVGTTL